MTKKEEFHEIHQLQQETLSSNGKSIKLTENDSQGMTEVNQNELSEIVLGPIYKQKEEDQLPLEISQFQPESESTKYLQKETFEALEIRDTIQEEQISSSVDKENIPISEDERWHETSSQPTVPENPFKIKRRREFQKNDNEEILVQPPVSTNSELLQTNIPPPIYNFSNEEFSREEPRTIIAQIFTTEWWISMFTDYARYKVMSLLFLALFAVYIGIVPHFIILNPENLITNPFFYVSVVVGCVIVVLRFLTLQSPAPPSHRVWLRVIISGVAFVITGTGFVQKPIVMGTTQAFGIIMIIMGIKHRRRLRNSMFREEGAPLLAIQSEV